ncbi:putative ankyrin repeat protein RF_0381 isoform X1 [Leptopilina boulardi]|uniref:putative ankyrin repeat protein RF_0381 isoform X1 n=1 Tax=Leptopilina boulardi TaxID=63433 RepID=UPI0021F59501|nr:putative ankyrin repeat protein RF_0381 isoform X1 [Leptopilina boulardi]XP_051165183.1 putative ankyrin repeat protein RF_0381 isoform X1 [Leptopilina boulardi]XP_051165184.1 putative ankyrin repeat protein RF_0381 isoform X1 [Leptopilina boulardi]XP_051165185.1 putative ankyrin repeat protein RF_0381 isoform X1 [Leptopilina boulardi]XP_051165186.1 putative ankyrin repeat protein RF_0381 isoform X1 [Leptopilina boulardi]XP_051165187.1 putative ankyrin repeat protein RF_0381 isoform X1 [Lep
MSVHRKLNRAVCEGSLEEVKKLINIYGLNYSESWKGGYHLLCDALERNNLAIAKLLLTRGSRVNSLPKRTHSTPLQLAIINGDMKIIKMILDRGAEINQSKFGKTALHIAIEKKKIEIIELLLKRGAEYKDISFQGKSLFYIAIEKNYDKIVKFLLQHGAQIDDPVQNDTTILQLAVKEKSIEFVNNVLKYFPDINNKNNRQSFKIAVYGNGKQYKTIVESLLEYGFNVNPEDANELLHVAVQKKYLKFVEHLLKQGADINAEDKIKNIPIVYAIKNKDYNLTKLLLNNGANVKDNPLLLRIAIETEDLGIVQSLLHHGVNINACHKDGSTALHCAVSEELEEITKLLLSNGANVNAKRIDGTTAFHIAAEKSCEFTLIILLEFGTKVDDKIKSNFSFCVDINSRDKSGKTALHIASQKGHDGIVNILLDYGADINITDDYFKTPFDCAESVIDSIYEQYSFEEDSTFDSSDDEYYHYQHNILDHVYGYKLIVKALQHHIIKLKTANLHVSKKNLQSLRKNHKYNDFINKCQVEVSCMKSLMINKVNISFYDIFKKNINSLSTYMKNEHLARVLDTYDYDTKFPIYASLLKSHFRNGIERKELLKHANRILYFLFKNFSQLPNECIEEIFKYLSNRDLRILTCQR